MAAGVGLGRDILRHRDLRGPLRLLRRESASFDQQTQILLRRRRKEAGSDLLARNFSDDAVGSDNAPIVLPIDAVGAITHQRQSQGEKGRCLD